MTDWDEETALEVNGEPLSLRDVLRSAKWRGQLGFIQATADGALIRQAAVQRGIEVSDDELQQAADDFRVARGLHEVEALEGWLAAHHLGFEEWESLLEDEVIARKLRDALTGGRAEQYFAENRLSFDAATISRLVVSDEDVAKELRAQITEEGADFYALARQHSIETATKPAGGYVGPVKRQELEAAAESAVFGAPAGKIVGPVKTDQGFDLIKVEALHPAAFNESTRAAVESLLFDEWLNEQRGRAKISVPLLAESED